MKQLSLVPGFALLAGSLGFVLACSADPAASRSGPQSGASGVGQAGGGASAGMTSGAASGSAHEAGAATFGGSAAAGSGGSAAIVGGTGAGGADAGGADVGGADVGGTNGGSTGGLGGSASGGNANGGSVGSAGSGGTPSANGCPTTLEGWATVNADSVNGTTGGGDAAPTTVKTFAELKAALQDSKPRVVVVAGTIKTTDGGGFALSVASNKTLRGADKNAKIYGGITLSGVSNVIIANLNIQGVWPDSGPDDTVASHGSHHIWYDHLNIWDAGDGALDITNESNYQTVSWTKFWYTSKDHPHRLASLNGSGGGDHPEDSGKLKVTYHHNWWSTLVNERMPRVMYGQGHQYNNFFNSPGNLYCIGVGSYGAALVENNYFKDVKGPHIFMYGLPMRITARGNVYDNTTGNKDTGLGGTGGSVDAFTPLYDYQLDEASKVPDLVKRCAGPQ